MLSDDITKMIQEDKIKIRNQSHERCIELFYPFMYAYKQNKNTIKGLFSSYIDQVLTTSYRETACFNGRYDNGIRKGPDKVHLYIQFDDVRLNLYYVRDLDDLKDAIEYTEELDYEYKVLVYEPNMDIYIHEINHDNLILIKVEEVEKL
ncbi:hypothetical protein RBU61_12800 [Tissierella sp. MB52-C2]|uniref:hypothetical protein n=1 Tax=Tissierella sp. MB52-C2 TaxID=3070999 RepID=UPI00280BD7C6|nr:hypothetical protein [Tissierella sp. MB52-C2]WMM23799.1 hypothetical protein RBU61_12800 [Tissierella sp. MB52-C2]